MKALVTGVAGFIGSSIARKLLDAGHPVLGVDAMTDYYDPGQKKLNLDRLWGAGFEFVEGDLCALNLPELLSGVTTIYHQAGQPGVRSSWGREFDLYIRANVLATQCLLEAAKGSTTLSRLVYASSSSIYGDAATYPTSEAMAPRPLSPYGVTKLAAEHLCTLYAANFAVPTVSLRYFTVYGPRQRPDMAFTRFIQAAIQQTPIRIFGDGKHVRDFTYIDDVVSANLLAAEADLPPGLVLNVAGGGHMTVNEVLDDLSRLAGRQLDIHYEQPMSGDVRRTGATIDLIHQHLSWEPHISVREGLARQYQWGQTVFEPAA